MEIIITNSNETLSVPLSDRGLQYGDGFFTTAKVNNGQVEYLDAHLARLAECAKRLYFENFDLDSVSDALQNAVSKRELAVAKVIVTRGSGGRGYQIPQSQQPTVIIVISDYPAGYSALKTKGVELDTLDTLLAKNPLLSGLKTLNRLEQVIAKREIKQKGLSEGLLRNIDGEVIETSIANLIIRSDDKLFTPDLSNSGIAGIYLNVLKKRFNVESCSLSLDDFYQAKSVYCCNSLMGLVPVTRIDDAHYDLSDALSFINEHNL